MRNTGASSPFAACHDTPTATPDARRGAASLEFWLRRDWSDGVTIDAVRPLQRLRVCTRNSVYDIIACDARGEIRVRGGRLFADWTTAHLAGSSAGGSVLKRLAIHVGFNMELHLDDKRVITSPVEAVSLLPDARTV